MDRGAWQVTIHRVIQSWTRLRWLSTHTYHLYNGWPGERIIKETSDACSVMSDSSWPHGLYPARLLCALDFPGKNTGVGYHFLLQGIFPILSKNWLIGKDPNTGKDWRQKEKGMTKDEMVRWHHWFNGHEFEQALGDGEEWGSLAYCHPQGCKESDMAEWLNNEQLGIFPIQRSNLFSCVSCIGRQILYQWVSQKAPKEAR